jgi:hypothetical protein
VFERSGQIPKSPKGKSKYLGSSDDDDVFLGDFDTRYLFLILCICERLVDMFFCSTSAPEVDETNIGNRDPALKHTYKGLPKLRYV